MTHYLLKYQQGKADPMYVLFDETGSRVMQNNSLHLLRSHANGRNITMISKDVPSELFRIIKQNYHPNNYLSSLQDGSILEESLQDNDHCP